MNMIGSVFRGLKAGLTGKRTWTPQEVRELIRAGKLDEAATAANALHPATPRPDLARTCLLAEIAFRQHRDDEAELGFRAVLKDDPGSRDAHYGLSLLLMEQGKLEASFDHALFARGTGPADPRFLAQLGYCYVQMKAYPPAEGLLRQAVRGDPNDKSAWNNLGIVLGAKGEPGEAMGCFTEALKLDPGFASAAANLQVLKEQLAESGATVEKVEKPGPGATPDAGDAGAGAPWQAAWSEVCRAARAGDTAAALDGCEALLLDHPDDALLAIEAAELHRHVGDNASSIDLLRACLARHPNDPALLMALGDAYTYGESHALALPLYEAAAAQGRDDAAVFERLGFSYHQAGRFSDAVQALESALARAPEPKYRKALASSLVMACRFDRAVEIYDDILAQGLFKPQEVIGNLTMALAYSGRFERAFAMLDDILENQAHDPALRLLRGVLHLQHGRYAEGWDDYAWRALSGISQFRALPFDKWDGEAPIEGKRLLVLAEQGLGDQVMFASCLPDLLALRPGELVVEAIDRVAPTLARSFPGCAVIATRQDRGLGWVKDLGDVDFYVPIGDLPRFFRRSEAAFPKRAYLAADPARVEFWRRRLEATGPRPWIGTSWRGGTETTRSTIRSMTPADLLPIATATAGTWVSLQYGLKGDAAAQAIETGALRAHWPEAIADLDEFAALVTALDAVVTVCNTTVHYAGALGRPTWVMAPRIPEWRYGLHNEAMPWYPRVRVVRQVADGDWRGPMQTIAAELADFFGHPPTKPAA